MQRPEAAGSPGTSVAALNLLARVLGTELRSLQEQGSLFMAMPLSSSEGHFPIPLLFLLIDSVSVFLSLSKGQEYRNGKLIKMKILAWFLRFQSMVMHDGLLGPQ